MICQSCHWVQCIILFVYTCAFTVPIFLKESIWCTWVSLSTPGITTAFHASKWPFADYFTFLHKTFFSEYWVRHLRILWGIWQISWLVHLSRLVESNFHQASANNFWFALYKATLEEYFYSSLDWMLVHLRVTPSF